MVVVVHSVSKRVLVYGGKGALGSALVTFFRSKDWVYTVLDIVDYMSLKLQPINSLLE